jgi:hypothetical protein
MYRPVFNLKIKNQWQTIYWIYSLKETLLYMFFTGMWYIKQSKADIKTRRSSLKHMLQLWI